MSLIHKPSFLARIPRWCMSAHRPTSGRAAFTLIELLTVVAILLVLMSLLLATLPGIKRRSHITQARHDIRQLEVALHGYFTEYKQWPTGLAANDIGPDIEATAEGIDVEPGVLAMLAGQRDASSVAMNPRSIPFFEAPSADVGPSGNFLDPWGNPYKYMLDYNRDDVLHVNFSDGSTNLSLSVAIWSWGPNGSDSVSDGANEDDVVTWK